MDANIPDKSFANKKKKFPVLGVKFWLHTPKLQLQAALAQGEQPGTTQWAL